MCRVYAEPLRQVMGWLIKAGGYGRLVAILVCVVCVGSARVISHGFTGEDPYPGEPPGEHRDQGRSRAAQPVSADIDHPPLTYSSYFGGGLADEGRGVAVDNEGFIYLVGETSSPDFRTANPIQPAFNGPPSIQDVFVSKFDPRTNSLVYSTYLGGRGSDHGLDIAVDSGGNAYVTGYTSSIDFPTTPGAFQRTLVTDSSGFAADDAFIAKLGPAGSLIYSTYLGGGQGHERANGVAVDQSGNVYVTGKSSSSDFPTTAGAFQASRRGFEDAFIVKLNATGSALVYSTYLGGSSNTDEGFDIGVDPEANACIAGHTASTDFPTSPGASQQEFGGGNEFFGDAFVVKLSASGSTVMYATYLGGSSGDIGRGIAIDAGGNYYVTGTTMSSNFPTANPIQGANAGSCTDIFSNCTDAFVTKLDGSDGRIVYSTYLGGGSRDRGAFQSGDTGTSIAVDLLGNAYVTGITGSTDFPVSRAIQTTNAGNGDAFVTKVDSTGSTLAYSSYFGGAGDEGAFGICVDSTGSIHITGIATSGGFPVTPNALQASFGGSTEVLSAARDAFIVTIGTTLPRITAAMLVGRRLFVEGRDFSPGAVILVNGDRQKTKNDVENPNARLIAKKAGKWIPAGVPVVLQVRNADGVVSLEFGFVRPE